MFYYVIQVRMNRKWQDWTGRPTWPEARLAKAGLQKPTDDPWWDKVRIRIRL